MTMSLRLNEPAVIADDIDGEIVIMNLERGSYFGLDAVGADIWRMAVAGTSGQTIAARIAAHFGLEAAIVEADVQALVAKALEHDLLVETAEAAADTDASEAVVSAGQYGTPELSVYSDMKDLLAFDPPLPSYEPVSDD